MLQIELTALRRGPIATEGELPPDHPLVQDLGFVFERPVHVTGRLTDSGAGRYYWQAELVTQLAANCRRCLTAVSVPVTASVQVLFSEDAGVDDASVYVIPPRSQELDLSEAIREELILALPEYVLCADDCRGICPGCGTDLNTGTCGCPSEADPRWAALEGLKASRLTEER